MTEQMECLGLQTRYEAIKADAAAFRCVTELQLDNGWPPRDFNEGEQTLVTFRELVRIMVDADLDAAGLPTPGEGKHCLADGRLAWRRRP